MNFNDILLDRLKLALTSIFDEIANKEGIKNIYSFGIYTDNYISTITLGYNTFSHYATQLKKYFLEYKRVPIEYRWTMPEWYGEILGDENPILDAVNDILYNRDMDSISFDTLYDIFLEAMLYVKSQGLFEDTDYNFFLWIEEGDASIDKQMLERIKKLLKTDQYDSFLSDMREDIALTNNR